LCLEISSLSSNLEIKNSELEAVASQLKSLTKTSELLSAELESEVSTREALHARYQMLETELSSVRSLSGIHINLNIVQASKLQFDEASAEHATLCKILEEKIEILDSSVKTLTDVKLELSSRMVSIQTMHDSLKEVSDDQTAKIVKSESRYEVLFETLKDAERNLESKESQLAIAESIVASLNQEAITKASKEEQVSTSRSTVPIDVVVAKESLSIETQTISIFSDVIETQTTSFQNSFGAQTINILPTIASSTQTEIDEVLSSDSQTTIRGVDMDEGEKKFALAKSSKLKYKSFVSELQSRIVELKDYITWLESQALEHTSKIAATEAILVSVQEVANDESKSRSGSLEGEKDTLILELNECTMENSLMSKRIDMLTNERSILTENISSLEKQANFNQEMAGDESKSRLASLEREKEALVLCISDWRMENSLLSKRVDVLTNESSTLTGNISRLEKEDGVYTSKAEVEHRRRSNASFEERDYHLEIQQQKSLLARKESEVRLLRDLAEELTTKVNKLEIQLSRSSIVTQRQVSPLRMTSESVPCGNEDVGAGSLRRAMSQILPAIWFSELQISPTRVNAEISRNPGRVDLLEGKIHQLVKHIEAANSEVDEVIKENNILRERLSWVIERRKMSWWGRIKGESVGDLVA
jgi:chromosome segregation ATPase